MKCRIQNINSYRYTSTLSRKNKQKNPDSNTVGIFYLCLSALPPLEWIQV